MEVVKHYFLQDSDSSEKHGGIDRKKMFELDIAVCLQVALLFDLFGNDDCVCLAGALDRATRQRSRVGSFPLFVSTQAGTASRIL